MARRGSRTRSGTTVQRYDPPLPPPRLRLSPLPLYEDRRFFHPLRDLAPPATFSRRDQRRLVEKSPLTSPKYQDPFPSLKLGFAVPAKVVKCVRRKQRRESIFATKKTGAGARSRRKRDIWSNVRC